MFASFLFFLWMQVPPTQTTQVLPDAERLASYEVRLARESASLFEKLPMRSVGPRAMGARVVDLEGFPNAPHTYLVAYASGGLWKTTNQGTTWDPLFDDMPSITIGDIATHPLNPDVIWVGTGEDNSSRSSYAGTGIYLSQDGGKTWAHKGLLDTHHISTVVPHPKDEKVVFVSVIGRLYTDNPERGVYKTTDGGATWTKVLFINEKTGVIDLVMDPKNPDRLYAAAWERSRKAWNFEESGPNSGIFISEDGGQTWNKATNGLPSDKYVGRIGLSICLSQPQTIYASIDYQAEVEESKPERAVLTKSKLAKMDKDAFLALKDKDINRFLRGNSFHKDITAENLRTKLKADEITTKDILDYVYDGNADLFNKPLHGAQIFRSDDWGKTWRKTHDKPIESFVHTYGYYFGLVQVDPNDPETIYAAGVPFIKSTDGGKTFQNSTRPGVHVDHQALWIDPSNSKHLVLGNDGGVYMSWDAGDQWMTFNYQPVGQFYTVTYDMAKPYNIYGGLQDNGVWGGPSTEQDRYHQPWRRLGGGDGAFVQVDLTDNRTIYLGYQFGHYQRKDLYEIEESVSIFPRHQLKETPYRFNWMTPFVLSRHQSQVAYMGGNRVLRSLNRGEDWAAISPDLTTNPPQTGDVVYGSISTLRESQKEFGTLFVGTDDGKVWVSRGNYSDWKDITDGIESGLWVSSIETSPHAAGEVFLTLTGYRNDDFRAYLYHSADYGTTWTSVRGDLPDEPCNVIRQDIKNPNLLYLGTDVGLWISFDKGKHWKPYHHGLPKVPVYALELHPREHELIVATHGRSIFVLEAHRLAALNSDLLDSQLHGFDLDKASVTFSESWGDEPYPWATRPREKRHSDFWYFTQSGGLATYEVSREGKSVYSQTETVKAGLNFFEWDYQVTPAKPETKKRKQSQKEEPSHHLGEDGHAYATPGSYVLKVTIGDQIVERTLTIKD